jgi:exopolysaccharide biosynthesis polyprenyl glycosylphosphotransferase
MSEVMQPGTAAAADDLSLREAEAGVEGLRSIETAGQPPWATADTVRAARSRDLLRRRALVGADLAGLLVAFGVMQLVSPIHPDGTHLLALAAALPLWWLLNVSLGLYGRDANLIHKSTLNELPTIGQSIFIGCALLALAEPLTGVPLSRGQVIVFGLVAWGVTTATRYFCRMAVRAATSPERVLIVGSGQVAGLIARKLTAHPEFGAAVVGYVDTDYPHDLGSEVGVGSEVGDFPRLGDEHEVARVCAEHRIERVVVAFSSLDHRALLDVITTCKRLHVKTSVVPRLFEVVGHGVEIDQVEGLTILGLRGFGRSRTSLRLKRLVDCVGAFAAIIVTAPILVAAALAVRLTSPGPVLFRQKRIGRDGKAFTMFKLRTMVDGADEMKGELLHLNEMTDGPMFKISDDPRVTPVGRFLRRSSIDELPQLWNVLAGEMSLVGPRPLVPDESDHIIGRHRTRLDLTPGLTGPWQVMGRNAIPFDEMVKLDYLYVAEWSLWHDVKLLVRTLPVVLGRRGA